MQLLDRLRPAPHGRHRAASVAEQLRRTTALHGCPPGELTALAAAGTPVRLPARWAVLREGTPADAVYLILDGGVDVLRGREPVAHIGSGDLFGEIPLLRGGLRTATVTSTDPVDCLRVDYARLRGLFAEHPALRERLDELARQRA